MRLHYPASGEWRAEAELWYTEILHPWRYRLTVRTEPSQGLNTGSIPVSATKNPNKTDGEVERIL